MSSIGDEDIDDTSATTNPFINGLLGEFHWSKYAQGVFSYAITDNPDDYDDTREGLIDDYPDDNSDYVFAMSTQVRNAIARSAEEFEKILTFTFKEDPNDQESARIRYGITLFLEGKHGKAPAYAYMPDEEGFLGISKSNWVSGDVFLRDSDYMNASARVGSIEYMNIMHETGHALGLKHGHEAKDDGDFHRDPVPYDMDSLEFTLMTYRGFIGAPTKGGYTLDSGNFAQTLMMLDIAALQSMYGADYTTNSGDTVYSWDPATGAYSIDGERQWTPVRNVVFMTVWDGGGNDTYDFSAYSDDIIADLSPGRWIDINGNQHAVLNRDAGGNVSQSARGNVFNAMLFKDNPSSLIENVTTGSGNDLLLGNQANNRLDGGRGRDQLFGSDGDDFLIGGAGKDEIHGGKGRDLAGYVDPSGVTVTITQVGAVNSGKWSVSGLAEGSGDTLDGIEGFRFGTGNDTVRINGASTVELDGGDGNDRLFGGTAFDTLIGGNGTDRLAPGTGTFAVYGGTPVANGLWDESLADNDTLVIDRSGLKKDYQLNFTGDTGPDDTGYFYDFLGSEAHGIARLDYTGGEGYDYIFGGHGNEKVSLGGDDDLFEDHGGNDTVHGNKGRDALLLGDGNDRGWGDAGDDTLNGGAGKDVLFGGDGSDSLFGGADNDRLYTGSGLLDFADGGDGDDQIFGGDGDNDLYGGIGRDRILGAKGDDFLQGGAESDVFIFGKGFGHDVIDDFDAIAKGGQDLLDVSAFKFTGFINFVNNVDIVELADRLRLNFENGASSIELLDVTLGSLDKTDFVFS